mmetsp:Transcript_86322/g.279513  ORF Transcript_86322/g.279513 Transcript_86322/m.279513 type:complete len:226 (+) Transcript_86322:173-850(+)
MACACQFSRSCNGKSRPAAMHNPHLPSRPAGSSSRRTSECGPAFPTRLSSIPWPTGALAAWPYPAPPKACPEPLHLPSALAWLQPLLALGARHPQPLHVPSALGILDPEPNLAQSVLAHLRRGQGPGATPLALQSAWSVPALLEPLPAPHACHPGPSPGPPALARPHSLPAPGARPWPNPQPVQGQSLRGCRLPAAVLPHQLPLHSSSPTASPGPGSQPGLPRSL